MHISVYPYIFISIYSHTYAFTHSIGVVVSMLRGRPLLQDGFPLIRGSASSAAHGNQDPCRGDVPCVQCPPSCREATPSIVRPRITCFWRLVPNGPFLNLPVPKHVVKGQSAIQRTGPPASRTIRHAAGLRLLPGYVMVIAAWCPAPTVHIQGRSICPSRDRRSRRCIGG